MTKARIWCSYTLFLNCKIKSTPYYKVDAGFCPLFKRFSLSSFHQTLDVANTPPRCRSALPQEKLSNKWRKEVGRNNLCWKGILHLLQLCCWCEDCTIVFLRVLLRPSVFYPEARLSLLVVFLEVFISFPLSICHHWLFYREVWTSLQPTPCNPTSERSPPPASPSRVIP